MSDEHFLYSDPRWIKLNEMSVKCSECHNDHQGVFDLTCAKPDACAPMDILPNSEIHGKSDFLSEDLCIVGGEHFFVRSILPIYIQGTDDEYFCYGIWSSLAVDNFKTYVDSFDSGQQSHLGPWFSWFSNELKGFPNSFNLKSSLVMQDESQRPYVVLDTEEDHPLVALQEDGISFDQLLDIYAENGHDIRPALSE